MYPRALVVLLVVGCGSKSSDGDEGSTTSTSTSAGTTAPTTAEGPSDTTSIPHGECLGPNNHLEGDKCFCDPGFEWCDPFDEADLSCCVQESTATTGMWTTPTAVDATGESSTGDPPACDAPPPDGCEPTSEVIYCQMGPGCEVKGSQVFWCDGAWQVDEAKTKEECERQGEAFSLGCEVMNGVVTITCAHGPGTTCDENEALVLCNDQTTLQTCSVGKTVDVDCVAACESGEVDGVMHDSGFCIQSRIMASCGCCDGPDCP